MKRRFIMTHYIENEFLKLGVKEQGCEITSIVCKETGFEYLWQGDESIWYGQSPVLFPIVGRLLEDRYTLDGKEYAMPKHGFARNLPWKLVSGEGSEMTFILSDDDYTFGIYPYHFDFIITYTLDKSTLCVKHCIVNKNDGEMYFSLGAHPAFNCEIGDRLVFSQKETLASMKIDLEKSLLLPETVPVLNEETDLVITSDIFNEDALIFEAVKSDYVTLKSDNHSRQVLFELGGAPYLGIWAKPGAPYVCIEPWYGVNDSADRVDFSLKRGINKLEKNESFEYTWKAVFKADAVK